jgi:hypothetical protein
MRASSGLLAPLTRACCCSLGRSRLFRNTPRIHPRTRVEHNCFCCPSGSYGRAGLCVEGYREARWRHEHEYHLARLALGVTPGTISQWLKRARTERRVAPPPCAWSHRQLRAEQLAQIPVLLARGPEAYVRRGDAALSSSERCGTTSVEGWREPSPKRLPPQTVRIGSTAYTLDIRLKRPGMSV